MSATVEPTPVKSSEIQGRIDAVEGGRVYGWAWDRKAPEARLEVQVWLGERHLGTVVADKDRSDLRGNGIGDGQHAFELALDSAVADASKGDPKGEIKGEITALARSPATGALVALAKPSAAESVAERVVAPPLRRIAEGLDVLRAGQRRIYEAQQAALQSVKDLVLRNQDLHADKLTALEQGFAEIRTAQQALANQFTEMEVFYMRFDAALRELDTKIKAPRNAADRTLRKVVAGLGVVLAVAAGLAIVAVRQVTG